MIRQSELAQIEALDKGEIFTKMTLDAKQLSHAFGFGIKFFQAIITIVIVFLYVFFLSFKTGLFLTSLLLLGVIYFRLHRKKIDKAYHDALRSESNLFERF